jgi:hypothetical protein
VHVYLLHGNYQSELCELPQKGTYAVAERKLRLSLGTSRQSPTNMVESKKPHIPVPQGQLAIAKSLTVALFHLGYRSIGTSERSLVEYSRLSSRGQAEIHDHWEKSGIRDSDW